MDNSESKKETPAVNEFMADPIKVSSEIVNAIRSGNLSPEFVEEHLGTLLKEARNVNETNSQAFQNERSIQKETIKGNLLTKLATLEEGKVALFKTLRTFCEENDLELHPEQGWAVRGVKEDEFSADWTSNDGEFAIKINLDNIFVYQKIGKNWFGMHE